MIIEPLFGKVFIKRAAIAKEQSVIWTQTPLPEDEGTIVHPGTSKVLKKGDRVYFRSRGMSEVQIDTDIVISVDEDQILAIVT